MLLGDMEQGAGCNARATGAKASGVLLVGFCLVVVRIEAAETVEEVAAIFAQGFDEGKADVAPTFIASSDVDGGGFDLFDKGLDVGSQIIGRNEIGRRCLLRRGGCRFLFIEKIARVKLFLCHGHEGIQG